MIIRRLNRRILIFLLIDLVLGLMLMWWVGKITESRMQSELLIQARIAKQALDIDNVAKLSGSKKDLKRPSYHSLKSRLSSMRKSIPQCRFMYLMGQQDNGDVFFFVDSLPPKSDDYAPPGTKYDEISDSYLRVFEDKTEDVSDLSRIDGEHW